MPNTDDDPRPLLLADQCGTCVFRPGNLMDLRPGRLAQLVADNLAAGSLLTCHQTLPYGGHDPTARAACRGFYDAYGPRVNYARIVLRLGGFREVAPPDAS